MNKLSLSKRSHKFSHSVPTLTGAMLCSTPTSILSTLFQRTIQSYQLLLIFQYIFDQRFVQLANDTCPSATFAVYRLQCHFLSSSSNSVKIQELYHGTGATSHKLSPINVLWDKQHVDLRTCHKENLLDSLFPRKIWSAWKFSSLLPAAVKTQCLKKKFKQTNYNAHGELCMLVIGKNSASVLTASGRLLWCNGVPPSRGREVERALVVYWLLVCCLYFQKHRKKWRMCGKIQIKGIISQCSAF